ncbi:MAG: sporulation protein YunB [Defluviitaleaceae bacterium]|nr:sporulation protein YunB [Defluviitaleaceae bacterium]
MRRYGRGFGPKPKGKKKRHGRLKFFLVLSVLVLIIIYLFRQFDTKMLPPALAMANMKVKTQMNVAINNALQKIIADKNATAEDFFTRVLDTNGKISSISVNTVLVNEVCDAAAVSISQELSTLTGEKVAIPVGALLGLDSLANTGPMYRFTVLPVGDATVDYESTIDTAGINQTMFQVYITVTAAVQIVNPLQNGEVDVSRKIPLVNAVLANDVPSAYLNAQNIGGASSPGN